MVRPALFSFASAILAAASLSAEPPPGYVLANGAVQIVGQAELQGPIEALDRLYSNSHPATRFAFAPSDDLAAIQSLTYGASALAPVGAKFPSGAMGPYQIEVGEPFGIRIAHASVRPGAAISPAAIIVHPGNPLAKLSAGQAARIFSPAGRQPALTHWGQLGLAGSLQSEAIHPCGLPESDHYPSEDAAFSEHVYQEKFGPVPAFNYQRFETYAEVIRQVAGDPDAIGVIPLSRVTPAVKVVAIAGDAWTEPSAGSAEDIVAGRYAYDRYLYIYARRKPHQPLDPLVRDYLRLVLSPEGQQAVANATTGYLPLNSTEIGEELARIR